ncbi:OLC1v1032008C1 [Oldenlandia corymbosa var. corymbosa]|uniref:OLC1v1032008C1 n=1 Tax=Oldenlandia corymbosa var. corymbosa TaxID=529605 RepID=A0AAV1CKL3_OLDCO|nr:OLC1v1032008C1 [Oldenlandia corymbosa var. corymbosa]
MEGGGLEGKASYYGILGVCENASEEEIRRAYRKLAMQWHPDRWTKTPYLLGEAKRKFQEIQEAYSVLSDKRKRIMYDTGLFDPNEEEDEGFSDFLQEMMSLMENVREENKVYSLDELQNLFSEMAQSFETSEWCSYPQSAYGSSQQFHEPFTFNCSGTSSNFSNVDGQNSFQNLVTEPYSSGEMSKFASTMYHEAWSSSSYAF